MCLLLLVFLFVFPALIVAQRWDWAVAGTGGSEGYAQALDPWGNVFEAGYNNNSGGNINFGPITLSGYGKQTSIVVKYDSKGQLQWVNTTTGGISRPMDIAADGAGNLYLLAWYADTSITIGTMVLHNATGTIGTVEVYLAKFSPFGNLLWAKNLSQVVNDTNAYYGETGTLATIGSDIYVSYPYKVPNLTIGSFSFSNADITGTTRDFVISKYDSAGNLVWVNSLGGTSDDICYKLASSQNGTLYLTGNFFSPILNIGSTSIHSATGVVFLAKYDTSANMVWVDNPLGTIADVRGLCVDRLGNAVMVGTYHGPIQFGSHSLNTDTVFYNAFITKYDSSGVASWAKRIPGNKNVNGYSVTADPCGNIWASCGMDKDTFVNIDGNILYAPVDKRDPMFFVGYDAGGNYIISHSLPTGGDDLNSINADGAGNIFIGGDSWGGPFVIGNDTLVDPNHAFEDIFALKYRTQFVKDTTTLHTLVCIVDSTQLQAPEGYPYYLWNDGTVGAIHKPVSTGVWTVYCTGDCRSGVLTDIITVGIGRLDTDYTHQDTFICINSILTLTAPPGYMHYEWSDGTTGQYDLVRNPGDYLVVCSGTCTKHTLLDTFRVGLKNVDLSFSIGPADTNICGPLILVPPDLANAYYWQDGSAGSSFTVHEEGIYYVGVSMQGCYYTDTINVHYPNLTQHLKDTMVCENNAIRVKLVANAPPGAQILWSTGIRQEDSITVTYPGTYWLRVSEDACEGSDTMTISTRICNCDASVPLAFTPNNDGLNDYLQPIFDKTCNVYDYVFAVYNRWRQMVFSTRDPDDKWDGTFKHVNQNVGLFMYFVEYKISGSRHRYMVKGDVTLVR